MPAVSEAKKLKNKARASLALLVIALISITTATYAWFTLSNSTSVQSMIVEVSTGVTLKAYAGATASTNTADYFSVIKSEGTGGALKAGEVITDALPAGVNLLEDVKLWPVTSGDGVRLYTFGTNSAAHNDAALVAPERKYYLQLTLTFLADTDMDVYLNGADSSTNAGDGTKVEPRDAPGDDPTRNEDAVKALRISFEDTVLNTSVIYEPDNIIKGGVAETTTTLTDNALADSIGPGSDQFTFTDLGDNTGRHKGNVGGAESPVVFSLKKGEPKQIVVRMWVEGEDAECINGGQVNGQEVNIEAAKMLVRLRFSGADADGNFIETPVN